MPNNKYREVRFEPAKEMSPQRVYKLYATKRSVPVLCDCFARQYDERTHGVSGRYTTNRKCPLCGGKGWHKKTFEVHMVEERFETVLKYHTVDLLSGERYFAETAYMSEAYPESNFGTYFFMHLDKAKERCNELNKEYLDTLQKAHTSYDLRQAHGKVYFRPNEEKFGYFSGMPDSKDVWKTRND